MARLRVAEATVKRLYGSATSCAYPGCDAPLIRYANDHDEPILNSQIAHIRAASSDGPRFDPAMTDEERRQLQNLLLLCYSHHAEVDMPELAERYPAEVLADWRRDQMHGRSETELPDELATRVIELDQLWSLWDFTRARIKLGGEGGQAPGAGGGGGGAIGPNARGGDGGPGGAQHFGVIDAALLDDETAVWIGPGGRPGVFGMPAECGSHTAFGRVVSVGGGRQFHEASEAYQGFAVDVVSATLADNVAVHDGLAYMHRAGWGFYRVEGLPAPFSAGLAVVLGVAWSGDGEAPDGGYAIEVIAELLTPSGPATFSVKRNLLFQPPGQGPGSTTIVFALQVRGTLHDAGVHTLHVTSDVGGHLDQSLMIVEVGSEG
jgi:hypothetical protein